MTAIIKRTTLIVRDITRAVQWYETVLGLRRWLDTPFVLSGIGLAAGKAGDKTHLVVMAGPRDDMGMIGLLQWVDPPFPAPAETPRALTFGAPIFVVASEDVAGAVARARDLGSVIHSEPRAWTFHAPDGARKDMIGASFFDLDGYFFEINQTIPAPATP